MCLWIVFVLLHQRFYLFAGLGCLSAAVGQTTIESCHDAVLGEDQPDGIFHVFHTFLLPKRFGAGFSQIVEQVDVVGNMFTGGFQQVVCLVGLVQGIVADAGIVAVVERTVSLGQQRLVSFQCLLIFLVQAVGLCFQTVDGRICGVCFSIGLASFDGIIVIVVSDVQACQLGSGEVVVGIAFVYFHVGANLDVGVGIQSFQTLCFQVEDGCRAVLFGQSSAFA